MGALRKYQGSYTGLLYRVTDWTVVGTGRRARVTAERRQAHLISQRNATSTSSNDERQHMRDNDDTQLDDAPHALVSVSANFMCLTCEQKSLYFYNYIPNWCLHALAICECMKQIFWSSSFSIGPSWQHWVVSQSKCLHDAITDLTTTLMRAAVTVQVCSDGGPRYRTSVRALLECN